LLKRILDIVVSFFGIIIFSPIYLIVAVLQIYYHGFPILFKQERPGLNGHPFIFLKFRTMSFEKDKKGNLLSDSQRITHFGNFLRKTSIDELPSLINVLKGDMSLVGPRPLLMDYLDLYNKFQRRRHEVKPGITGWAQINGRNTINWEKKFELDVWYVDNYSLGMDIKILLITFLKVLKREGISAAGEATMTSFKGNNEK
jgi:sugar transferase EpsL|tara:strand:- start:30370 stop:30969 length:600 start_codon:yes stop_codon:yes gene_type:complete